jgi:sec-independent protein translocase protein TatC
MAQIQRTTQADDSEETQVRMSFGEHLEELRKRIIRAIVGSIGGIALCLYYYKEIVAFVSRPYRLVAREHDMVSVLSTMKPQEAFLTSITLAFQAGLVLSSPWIIYQIWQFVAAGLYKRERRIVYRYMGPSALLFMIGVAFFYFIVLPMTLNFFVNFSQDPIGGKPAPNALEVALGLSGKKQPMTQPTTRTDTQPAPLAVPLPVLAADPPAPASGQALIYMDEDGRVKIRMADKTMVLNATRDGALFASQWRYDDYLSFVTFTALVFGVAFELPLVIVVLAQIGIVQVQTLRRVRKYAYFGIVAVAAIAAPSGDLMTLAFLSVPLILLYELGIVASAMIVGRQDQAGETPA